MSSTYSSLTYDRKLVDFPGSEFFRKLFIFTRLVLGAGIATLVAGSALIGDYNKPDSVLLGSKLAKAGYLIITVIVFVIWGYAAFLWTKWATLSPSSRKVSLSSNHEISNSNINRCSLQF
jgi:hypothetical protein